MQRLRNGWTIVLHLQQIVARMPVRGRTVIVPADGQKSTAFSTSLSSSCTRRSGAPRMKQGSAGVSRAMRACGNPSRYAATAEDRSSRRSKFTDSACLMLSSTRAAAPSALKMDCRRWVPSRARVT